VTWEDQVGVFDHLTMGLKDTRIFVDIAIELPGNLREGMVTFRIKPSTNW
jgi:hypothetical protein